jgi:glucokinase
MALLGIDLGGTKLALAVFSDEGKILYKESAPVGNLKGKEVGKMITGRIGILSPPEQEV